MSRIYLILFSEAVDRSQLTQLLDQDPNFTFWFYNLPYSVFIKTNVYFARDISMMLRGRFGHVVHFVILVDGNFHGILPDNHLQFFDNASLESTPQVLQLPPLLNS